MFACGRNSHITKPAPPMTEAGEIHIVGLWKTFCSKTRMKLPDTYNEYINYGRDFQLELLVSSMASQNNHQMYDGTLQKRCLSYSSSRAAESNTPRFVDLGNFVVLESTYNIPELAQNTRLISGNELHLGPSCGSLTTKYPSHVRFDSICREIMHIATIAQCFLFRNTFERLVLKITEQHN